MFISCYLINSFPLSMLNVLQKGIKAMLLFHIAFYGCMLKVLQKGIKAMLLFHIAFYGCMLKVLRRYIKVTLQR